jgi:hypothetical protein
MFVLCECGEFRVSFDFLQITVLIAESNAKTRVVIT